MWPKLTATAFLADPSGASPLVAASRWIEGTLLGTMATLVAVLCVASVGFLMLSGRIDVRRGLAVVLGCFILFGAPIIVGGLQGMGRATAEMAVSPAPAAPPPPAPMPDVTPPSYDPYAGAAVVRR